MTTWNACWNVMPMETRPLNDDTQQVIDQITLLEPFCKQAANAMCRLYGNDNNKWALLMPGLIHQVSVCIGSTVSDICQSDMDEQQTFLPQLLSTLDVPEDLSEDDELARAIKIRQTQLTDKPLPAQSLNPFRDIPKDRQMDVDGPDPDDDPDLIV